MAWQRNYVTLKTCERIRYSLIQRPDSGIYNVRFKGPDRKWKERSTGATKRYDAIDPAHRIILEEYEQIAPTSEAVAWLTAKEKLSAAMTADGKRPKTIKGYVETLDKLIALFPLAKGPADISDRTAADFKTKYATGRFTAQAKDQGRRAGRSLHPPCEITRQPYPDAEGGFPLVCGIAARGRQPFRESHRA